MPSPKVAFAVDDDGSIPGLLSPSYRRYLLREEKRNAAEAEKRRIARIPVLLARQHPKYADSVFVWCPDCRKDHTHCLDPLLRAGKLSHRQPHCEDRNGVRRYTESIFNTSGYFLKLQKRGAR